MLGRALAHEAQGVAPAVDGHVEPSQKVGDRADVILVPVREKEAGHMKPLEGREVGVHDVDPQASTVERDAAVDDQRLASLLEGQAVHADLPEPTERDDAERGERGAGAHGSRAGLPHLGACLARGRVLSVASSRPMSTLADKRFVLVTGKGGVGKTTVCAAEALALAAKGKRVLVAMCNAKERLSAMLGAQPLGAEVKELAENVWGVNIVPERALEEYGALVLHSRALYRTLFDNKYVRTFLRAVPGMQEWAMLGKAWWHTTETRPDGSPKYDVVILDAPATGHGIDMLRVPRVILDVVPAGLLRRDAERAWHLFQDREACAIVVVTLPEEMPTTETIELAGALAELGLPVSRIIVNEVLPPLFSRDERAALEGLVLASPSSPADAVLLAGRDRATRERFQAESLNRLSRELPVPPAFLPLLFEDAATPEAIRQLAKRV